MDLLITNIGLKKANEAQAGGWLIKLTHFGLSDSTEFPSPEWESLPGEKIRLPITAYYIVDNNTVEFRCIADESIGDFWVRLFGLYLEDGTLFAVGETPLSQKLRGTRLTVKAQVRLVNAVGTFDFKDLSKDWVTILFHELAATAGSLWQAIIRLQSQVEGLETRISDFENWKNNISQEG